MIFKPVSELSKLFIKVPKTNQKENYNLLRDSDLRALLSQSQYD